MLSGSIEHVIDIDCGVAPGGLSDAELVAEIVSCERGKSALEARQLALIAEVAGRAATWLNDPNEFRLAGVQMAAAELSMALVLTRSTATARVDFAVSVTGRLPGSVAALAAGEIDVPKLKAIERATMLLDGEVAARVEARVLPKAGSVRLPAVKEALERAVIAVDPGAAQRRGEAAVRDRRVQLWPGDDGMAEWRAVLGAERAIAGYQALDELALRCAAAADTRTADQLRADTLVDVLLAAAAGRRWPTAPGSPGETDPPGGRRGRRGGRSRRWGSRPRTVHVTVPLTTLIGLTEDPGQLRGFGPITAQVARELAATDAVWRRLLTDPVSGTVLDVGRTTYTPPAGLAEHVRTRDGTCRFVCCGLPSLRADLDHTVPFPIGATSAEDLSSLCRHHHLIKGHSRWQVEQTGGGTLRWTSPTGQVRATKPWQADPSVDDPDGDADVDWAAAGWPAGWRPPEPPQPDDADPDPPADPDRELPPLPALPDWVRVAWPED